MVEHFQLIRSIVPIAVARVLFVGRKHARPVVEDQRLLGDAVEARQLAGGETGFQDVASFLAKGGLTILLLYPL